MQKTFTSLSSVYLVLAFCYSAPPTCAQESGRIKAIIFDAVVQIKTPAVPGGPFIGTGFLALPSLDGTGRVYLVTNKHMIGTWQCPGNDVTGVFDWIDVFFYRIGDPDGHAFKATRIQLKDKAGHPDEKKYAVLQRFAVEKLHRYELLATFFADVVNCADIWVIQCRGGLCFATKAFQCTGVVKHIGRKEFQTHSAMEPRVFGLIDDTPYGQ